MPWHKRTYREVDGARVEGTWRPAFIRNGDTYYLTDLLIYADGTVDCGGLAGFDEFCAQVRSGWVATAIEPGVRASAFMVASWRMTDPVSRVRADELIAEVRDEIARLRGEPTSQERCVEALRGYLAQLTAEQLDEVRAAYLEVPGHLRVFLLGDQDVKDGPLRQLLTPAGERLIGSEGSPDAPVVTEVSRQRAISYLTEWVRGQDPEERARYADPERPPVQRDVIRFASETRVVGAGPAEGWLSPDSPHPVTADGVQWPTVLHAYCAASVPDRELADRVRACGTAREALRLVRNAPRRERWPEIRLAVMARLLRLKFEQHPALAAKLVMTGDSILAGYVINASEFWDIGGQNWTGRLLELVRAELVLAGRLV
ncbi:MAG: NADAR family protein [Streptosporangiaceae bacterium]|nr:NADAR family protein [Streptosporangiaceae bacterium]MBV9857630.1 NADAR family protein [Streptosporangiaceae bacterium]